MDAFAHRRHMPDRGESGKLLVQFFSIRSMLFNVFESGDLQKKLFLKQQAAPSNSKATANIY